ncbi:F0F1 ATP synthase subunit B [Spiroplasma endosymbiont of Polydrusus pterygomalis]|uniref:F0F1 ATP synthase subunit B n=1 Tax=Spiroplasma endosymbiont of Polydrusus pterygomalis TaxID=3139327 RepID=UPI003CCAE0D7
MNFNFNDLVSGDDIVNQLFPNLPVFIAHIFATVILLMVLWRWVYAPFRKTLHARHLVIREKLDDAASKQSLANQDRGEASQILKAAKIEAQEIIANAQNDGYNKRKQIIDKAQEESMRITNQSNRDLIRARKELEAKINEEIKVVALEVTKEIIGAEINAKKHEQLIDDFIKNLK